VSRHLAAFEKQNLVVVGLFTRSMGILGAGLATTMGLVATIVGAVLIITGIINFCPLFKVLGISSYREG